jgi:hypothetical protein
MSEMSESVREGMNSNTRNGCGGGGEMNPL